MCRTPQCGQSWILVVSQFLGREEGKEGFQSQLGSMLSLTLGLLLLWAGRTPQCLT